MACSRPRNSGVPHRPRISSLDARIAASFKHIAVALKRTYCPKNVRTSNSFRLYGVTCSTPRYGGE